MATAMIAWVAIGIAVDDTIHVFHGFRDRVRQGIAPTLALARSYRSAGRAVVVTTIILSAQFMILTLSDFVPTRNFGMLTTIGLIAALLFDLMLLPAILIGIYHPASPIHRLFHRSGTDGEALPDEALAEPDPGVDTAFWTPQRRLALVREVIGGKVDVAGAARQYELPEDELARWITAAEHALSDAFDNKPESDDRSQAEKLRALAKAYRRLKAENRELKAQLPD
jgi:hypothetical protein